MTVDVAPVFRASAPARIDLAGGWTDVAPFAAKEGGVVVNAAIELRAQAEVWPGGTGYILEAQDLGTRAEIADSSGLRQSGHLDLLKAALRRSGQGPCILRTRSEAPAGSGLGSSGALDVALVAALDAARGVQRLPTALAEEAFQLEAVDAELPGGRQDQYAAALGGIHRFGFAETGVVAQRIRLDGAFAAVLAEQLVVCYTGISRVSSDTISRVMGGYERGDGAIAGALRGLVEVAERMAEALRAGDLSGVGSLLSLNWRLQQRLDRGMRTEPMARLEAAMRASGILGGKAVGAGAGGSMIFLLDGDAATGRRAAIAAGARLLPFTWASEGVRLA